MQSDMPLAKAETRWTRISQGRVPIYIPYLFLIPALSETRGHLTTGNAKFYKKQLEELLQSAPQRAM